MAYVIRDGCPKLNKDYELNTAAAHQALDGGLNDALDDLIKLSVSFYHSSRVSSAMHQVSEDSIGDAMDVVSLHYPVLTVSLVVADIVFVNA
ncbi:hypothetical protein NDU88_007128 [Pleurodeles waltl]|uniref:Uncharacterized protein n=1 Tax=Pleurodeles waltl TaxID=8319 RepID=A0AAV7UMZ5_PLEWA|nr:hypothetical protein NDU88_007128 [Pleurodeles waltl]